MKQFGIYEQIITQLLEKRLDHNTYYIQEKSLSKTEAALWLSRVVSQVLHRVLESFPNTEDRLQKQIELSNRLLLWLKEQTQDKDFIEDNLLHSQGKILTALYSKENPNFANFDQYILDIFPLTGLTQSELFCGNNSGLSLESELKREIQSSDRIYWLVSFIKWSGLRIFREDLKKFTQRGGQLKIITTSYMGATDAKAIEFLAKLPNTEIKISYNTKQERLHAKSYLFLRDTQFHTGYIGSSNLSNSALTNGLEWNVKITSQEIPQIINKSLNTFETYWESNEFETFISKNEAHKIKLRQALSQQRNSDENEITQFFSINPFPHQQEILERLQIERQLHNRFKNLVVAATGTGKTLISAFDFACYYKTNPQATFLFVAHREEILKQARNAYRHVLHNSQFGELWVGHYEPQHYRQLFVSIQTINNQFNKKELNLSTDYYDYIVIDEVHHITAQSYRKFIEYFRPSYLLGLTATPERHDGENILDDFGGVIAAELRLPEAINRRYLSPFQYFAIDDDTDLRQISWNKGRYDIAQLNELYTNNSLRVHRIISSLSEIVTNINTIKALAFCVSQKHADYMANQFLQHNIKADVLTSKNSQSRTEKQQAIRSGNINILCVVDIFNEGIDIPEIDTLLFLRPTESLTIFLQQLGRGLRLCPGKDYCTILDFVGNAHTEYDFSSKFRALTGKTHTAISQEITQGFPHAPLGCLIELSKRSQETILNNIKNAVINARRLTTMITQYPQQTDKSLTLANFLSLYSELDLNLLYKCFSWNELVFKAQNQSSHYTDKDYKIIKNAIFRRFLVCDDYQYLSYLKKLCERDFEIISNSQYALMLHYDFWQTTGPKAGFSQLAQSIKEIEARYQIKNELYSVIHWQQQQLHHKQSSMPEYEHISLQLHARYSREQILVAFGANTFTTHKSKSSREGVFRIETQQDKIELLFVTLDKTEGHFSPATMYHDYAINKHLFHWQSQNNARPDRGKGKEYIIHKQLGKRLFLFVREKNKDEYGRTQGFINYGEVEYVNHVGSQPMNITWRVKTAMPSFMQKIAEKFAVG